MKIVSLSLIIFVILLTNNNAQRLCGRNCPPDTHPVSRYSDVTCGSSSQRNAVSCAKNEGSGFDQCGLRCPSGYHALRYYRNNTCSISSARNSATCTKTEGRSFRKCGTSCPSGYTAIGFHRDGNCGVSSSITFSDNAATCQKI